MELARITSATTVDLVVLSYTVYMTTCTLLRMADLNRGGLYRLMVLIVCLLRRSYIQLYCCTIINSTLSIGQLPKTPICHKTTIDWIEMF